ncbi:MAG TPA: bacillithiol biosynthesis deacetylase BshB1 [Bacteroidota bacterium]|nr:bacillithiol biosynthesis deacetylase BshB1 [Bacteroidota bacterium]
MQTDILAIGAHPDDVELCCAGTLAKLVRKGLRAVIVDVTEGELGTRGTKAIRSREATAAAAILGCTRENLFIPDGGIEVNAVNIRKMICLIRKYRPKMLLIPHWLERHPDHVHTHHLCKEAWFYAGLRKIPTKYKGRSQNPWRPGNYLHYMQWYEFSPSFIVDISDVYDVRLKAIRAHKSQFYDPRSKEPGTKLSEKTFLDFVRTRAKVYGVKIGVQYGEPFYSVEAIGIENPLKLKMFRG